MATDFHIGGVIGDSFELYYMNKLIFFDSEVVTSVYGVGVTYPLNPDFSISGGIGVTGLGLVAGGGYQLSPRWALHLDLMYTKDNSVVGAQLTINIVSH